MPVPARVRVLDRDARLPLPVPLQRLLQGALQHQGQATGQVEAHGWPLYGKYFQP